MEKVQHMTRAAIRRASTMEVPQQAKQNMQNLFVNFCLILICLLLIYLFPHVKDGQRGVTASSYLHRLTSTPVPEPHGALLRARTLRSSGYDTPALTSSPWTSPTTVASTCC
ncbi:Cardiac phospholamban [Bagarius yarrelli]|uniref:Phospholamban n=1 Tax=Bagarius yarrelli TaxID=175774 RepID=A0A556UYD0_BAGYA|nr:Cardiac phospholamban [Bagarius yarrelli]